MNKNAARRILASNPRFQLITNALAGIGPATVHTERSPISNTDTSEQQAARNVLRAAKKTARKNRATNRKKGKK